MMQHILHCWCGNGELTPFTTDYLRCPICETLVAAQAPTLDIAHITDDDHQFYGREYWFSHQEKDLGFANIMTRARADLSERCLHWLRIILKYKIPPAKALELGSAHGGFVALLRWAGYDATGLELSPWVVDFAHKTFEVPMLMGPIEDQSIEPASLDLIVLMDVLEHLPDPVTTISHCLRLLEPDGILVIQTPCYPEDKTYDALASEGDRFLKMLKPDEHLHLFSQRAVRDLFQRLGVDHVVFEPAMFAYYDMFLVVSKMPLAAHSREEVEEALAAKPASRIVQALLDADSRLQELLQQHIESESDHASRLEGIYELTRLLQESEVDRAARLASINNLTRLLQEAEADRAARLASINHLTRLLQEAEADRAMRLEGINELTRQLQESEADRTTRLMTLNEQARQLEAQQRERDELNGRVVELQQQFDALAVDGAAQARVIAEQQKQLEVSEADRDQLRAQIDYHNWRWAMLEPVLRSLRVSRAYRLIRKLSRWEWLEQALWQTLPASSAEALASHTTAGRSHVQLKRAIVDLTPVQPGGENGGAKLVAVELVKQLAQLATDCEWVVLTSAGNHEELSSLDSHNVRRLCVVNDSALPDTQSQRWVRLRTQLRNQLAVVLPPRVMTRLRVFYRKKFHRPTTSSLPKRMGADLVFCPFTAPLFFDPEVPLVIVIYDLQYLHYPQFFTAEERYYRDRDFRESCRLAARLVCISDYVRETVLQTGAASPERLTTIHIRLANRLTEAPVNMALQTLPQLSLQAEQFLLYPANFWPHKNHELLFTAFGIYLARHPQSDLKLICTGAPGERMEFLREVSSRMGLDGRVIFPGYLSDDEFATLMQLSFAVIFPSLYEGFGMPILEAMAFGKPVLCSNVTSLPEIAGDAALMFDPRKPLEIVNAIESIENNPDLVLQLRQRGAQRLKEFDQPGQMAQQYLQIFHEVVSGNRQFTPAIHGIYADGWTSERVAVMHGASDEQRYFETKLTAPTWLPFTQVSVRLSENGTGPSVEFVMARGQTVSVRHPLPMENGFIEMLVDPVFQPQAYQLGDDTRLLGCQYETFNLVAPSGVLKMAERKP